MRRATRAAALRYLYAIGGNESAARLAGIRVSWHKARVCVISGVLAGLAGLVHCAQLEQGNPNDGVAYELDAIAAVVIGGTSLSGGTGSVAGTLVGILTIGVINNSMGLNNVDANLQLILKGAIILSPNEAKPLTPIVKRAFEAGVPVIVLDREIEGDTYTTFIGADNRAIGHAAGEYVAKVLNGAGDIVEIKGLPGSTPARDRSEGFREAIARVPTLRIIHDPVANWLREEVMSQMESALAAHPKIDLVYAHNDPMAIGANLAAKAKGREAKIKFVGIDGLPGLDGGRQAVQDGKLAATFVYPTGGKEAVAIVTKILKGEQVPHRITLATEQIANAAR